MGNPPNSKEFRDIVLSKAAPLASERIVTSPDGFIDLAALQYGVVFVYAMWSGPCHVIFPVFCRAVAAGQGDYPVVVLDTDDVDHEKLFGQVPTGSGEVYWIKDGQIRFFDRSYLLAGGQLVLASRVKEWGGD